MAQVPVRKQIFLMFGEVDIDFSFYRKICEDFKFDLDEFVRARVAIYNDFLRLILDAPAVRDYVSAVFVLCPHPTPLRDREFFPVTARTAKISQERLCKAGDFFDLGHRARIQRLLDFNNALEQGIIRHDLLSVRRIDDLCLDANGMLLDHFYPKNSADHHTAQTPSRLSWYEKLRSDVPAFNRVLMIREQKKKLALSVEGG
jgi:hypothetical protein